MGINWRLLGIIDGVFLLAVWIIQSKLLFAGVFGIALGALYLFSLLGGLKRLDPALKAPNPKIRHVVGQQLILSMVRIPLFALLILQSIHLPTGASGGANLIVVILGFLSYKLCLLWQGCRSSASLRQSSTSQSMDKR